jgi:hypothetical protein
MRVSNEFLFFYVSFVSRSIYLNAVIDFVQLFFSQQSGCFTSHWNFNTLYPFSWKTKLDCVGEFFFSCSNLLEVFTTFFQLFCLFVFSVFLLVWGFFWWRFTLKPRIERYISVNQPSTKDRFSKNTLPLPVFVRKSWLDFFLPKLVGINQNCSSISLSSRPGECRAPWNIFVTLV